MDKMGVYGQSPLYEIKMAKREKINFNTKNKRKLNQEELQFIDVIQTALNKLDTEFELESIEIRDDDGFNKKYNIVIKEVTY